MTYISEALRQLVYERAGGRCEYCLLHSDDAFFSHETDHIQAEKHGGETEESNLCLSCFFCNRHKGSDIASLDPDPETGELTELFHPRRDTWAEHFWLEGPRIEGLTPQGRATVRLLQMNAQERILERAALIQLARYPVP